jgi:DMSO/TMAO reductase YedYZ molybdopterin-dependent catalytic subunit
MADHLDTAPPEPAALQPDPPDPTAAGPRPSPGAAALAGAVAALAALAAGELVSSVAGTGQSLVASVGTAFIDRFAASLKDVAVEIFGTNDKAALIVGIVIVATAIGAGLGVAARGRPWVASVGFGAFGIVGLMASLADPQSAPVLAAAAAGVAVLTGVWVLHLGLMVATTGTVPLPGRRPPAGPPTDEPPTDEPPTDRAVTEYPTDPARTRRAFVRWVGGVGGLTIVTYGLARALTGRSAVEVARSEVKLPPLPDTVPPAEPAPLGVPGLSPYYVSNDDFYLIDTALVKPQVDPATWRLRIAGRVDRPYELSFADLLALPQVEEAVTLSCVSNEVGGDLVGNARWQGVRLADVLERAGVQPDATQIVGVSVDGWTAGFPTAAGLDGRVAMIAIGMNGEPLPIIHGFPARLVVSGLYGYVSATKWLQEIRLTTLDEFDGYWIAKGWSKQAPVKTQSRIDVPRAFRTLPPGPTKVAGVAWAPDKGIAKVEVQIGNGPWQEARLGEVVSDNTWVQWVLDWDAPEGEHTIAVRATDTTGYTQTPDRARPDPDGATGWHKVTVPVRR